MAYDKIGNVAFVDADGNYCSETDIVLFPIDTLNEEQWEVLSVLPDSDRLPYVEAILNGQDASEWEQ